MRTAKNTPPAEKVKAAQSARKPEPPITDAEKKKRVREASREMIKAHRAAFEKLAK